MSEPFWDREQELGFLAEQYRQPGSNLVVLYGRRRVGKTTTVARFCADKPSIIYLADRSMETTLQQRLLNSVARYLGDDLLGQVTPPNWDWIFGQFVTRADFQEKIVLLLNKSDPSAGISVRVIENHLKHKVFAEIPLESRLVLQSVNQGIPYMIIPNVDKRNPLIEKTNAFARLVLQAFEEKVEEEEKPEERPLGRLFQR